MFRRKRLNTFFMKTGFTLKSAYDGVNLSAVVVEPDYNPDAVLQIAHGLCGCKERYLPFMKYMADHGVACVACDHRGHGRSVKSKGDLGYMYEGGYVALVEDMKLVTDWIARKYHNVPVVLLGHSMGSLAARIYAKEYDWELAGLILCGTPGYNPMVWPAMLLTGMLNAFDQGRVRPTFLQQYASSRFNRRFASEGELAWVCSDPRVRERMLSSRLNNVHITANMMHNLMLMMAKSHSSRGWRICNPELPVTFLSGEDDAAMGGEKKLHDAAKMMVDVGYHNVTAAIFSEMRHEILNEVDKEVVWDDILNFIRKISSK